MLDNFIWDREKPRIKNSVIQLSIQQGGLAVPNLTTYYFAAKLENLAQW